MQLTNNVLWNRKNLENSQLCNHLLDQLEFLECHYSSFLLSVVEKVMTGTWSFASVNANVDTWLATVPPNKKQFADQVNYWGFKNSAIITQIL